MKLYQIVLAVLLVLVLGVAGMAPIGPLPGLFIRGVETEPPTNWPDTSGIHEVKLKVMGAIPRVVIIWVIQYEGEIYVVGNSDSGWTSMLGAGGPVELRIDDATYPLDATRMESGWEPIMLAYVDKYRPDYPDIVNGFPSIEDAAGQISVFHLAR